MEKLLKMVKDSGQLLIKNYMIGLPIAVAMLVSLLGTLSASLAAATTLSFLVSLITAIAVLTTVVSVDGLMSNNKFDHTKSLNAVMSKAIPLLLVYLVAALVGVALAIAAYFLSAVIFRSAGPAGMLFYGAAGLVWLWIGIMYFSFADMIVLFENKQVPDVFIRNNDIVKPSILLVTLSLVLFILASYVCSMVSAVFAGALGTILMYVLQTVLLVWLMVMVRYQVYKDIAKGSSKK